MSRTTILTYAASHALAAVAYIGLVAAFMSTAARLFGPKAGYLGSVLFLLVFVISAAMMGMLVFGRPILWYLRGLPREAVALAIATVGCLALIALLIFAVLVIFF